MLDTASEFNLILRDAFPDYCQRWLIHNEPLPNLEDENVNPHQIQQAVTLLILFGDALCLLRFLVADHVSFRVIVGTGILNRNVESIWCTIALVKFIRGEVPILDKGNM